MLRVAKTVVATEAEGPGLRSALWVQGCTIRCAECCNPEMFRQDGGTERALPALVDELTAAPVEGITILGGEPFEQAAACAALAEQVQDRGLSVMVFTGYGIEDLRERGADAGALLAACDLLVDGPYRAQEPEPNRRWIGSCNQRMHFLSDRYDLEDPQFLAANTVEIRFQPGQLTVNGWPSGADLIDLRRRGDSG